MSVNLVIGIGGTGGNTIRNLKYKFSLYREEETVEYIYLDTLSFDKVEKAQEESSRQSGQTIFTQVPIELSEYIHYQGENLKTLLRNLTVDKGSDNEKYRWVKAKKFINELRIPDKVLSFEAGAGQYRQIGRLAVFQNINTIWNKLSNVFASIGTNETLNVHIACSLVGGTGSGGFLDTTIVLRELARRKGAKLHIFLFLVLESAFSDLKGNQEFQHTAERAYAVLRELHRLIQTYTPQSPLTVVYNEQRMATIEESAFDGVFLIDMPSDSVFSGEKLRANVLYPSISDIIELFTEKETGKKLDEDVVNVNSAIRRIQNNLSTSAEELSNISLMTKSGDAGIIQANFPQFEPFFSTFTTHRIMFPRKRFLKKLSLKLSKTFLAELFKPDQENNLLRADFYPEGKESGKDKKQIQETVLEEAKDFFIGWHNVLSQSFFLNDTTLQKWDAERENNFMNQRSSMNRLLNICVPRDKTTDIRQLQEMNFDGLDALCTSDDADRDNITKAVAEAKEKFHGPMDEAINGNTGEIHNKLRNFSDFWVNSFEEKLKNFIVTKLTPGAIDAKRGRFGYLLKALDQMGTAFIEPMLRRLEDRHYKIKQDWDNDQGKVANALLKINETSGGFLFGNLKKEQQAYLKKERSLLKTTKAAIANRYIMATLIGARNKVSQWKSECERWRNEIVTHDQSVWNKIVEQEAALNAELRQLAQSPNISFGLPGEMGKDKLHPVTDMGGYEEYLCGLIDFDEKVRSWLETLEWQIKDDKNLNLRLFSEKIDVVKARDLCENLLKRADEDCHHELGSRDIFDYLLNYLPNRSKKSLPIEEAAKQIAQHFSKCSTYLKYDETNVMISHYLFYKSPNTPAEKTFMDELERELQKVTNKFGAYNRIEDYEASEILGYIKVVHGIVSKTCNTTKAYQDAYLEKIRSRSWMMDIYHIFPEEQACVDYEMNILAPKKALNDITDLASYHVTQLFSNTDYLNLFYDLFALGVIETQEFEQGKERFYLWLGDQALDALERDKKDHKNCFYLSDGSRIFDAVINFTNKVPNKNPLSSLSSLPSYDKLTEVKRESIEVCLADPEIKAKDVENEEDYFQRAFNKLLARIESSDLDFCFYSSDQNRAVEENFRKIFCNLLEERANEYRRKENIRKTRPSKRSSRI